MMETTFFGLTVWHAVFLLAVLYAFLQQELYGVNKDVDKRTARLWDEIDRLDKEMNKMRGESGAVDPRLRIKVGNKTY